MQPGAAGADGPASADDFPPNDSDGDDAIGDGEGTEIGEEDGGLSRAQRLAQAREVQQRVLAQRRRDIRREAMVRASRNASKIPKGKKGKDTSTKVDEVWG